MNIISCDFCAVILDGDKLSFPRDIYVEDEKYSGERIDETRAKYDNFTSTWTAFVPCPVCGEAILKA
jgi:hypothetical protein